ncbi:MAG: FAD-dependent oxidoreductase, partial [Acidobacteriota bacterium]|nr:FAD-dependent oxidoreductase [Acidobacteriota bacterium]
GHHIDTASMWRPPLGGPQASPPLGGPSRETVREWLTRLGQAPRLCELFWEPLALAALNQSIDQAAASYFVGILERMFGPDPSSAALVMPVVPLDELYAEPARAWLEARGHEVRVNAPARVVVEGDRVTGVRVRGEHISAPVVISTVPWHALGAVFEEPPAALAGTIANASALGSLPIVTVNLWFDRPVMHEALIGLPGRAFQWVFDRRAIVGGASSHLSMISSGAETIVAMGNDELIALALADVRAALPAARSAVLRKGLAVREKRSTFSLAPDAPPRPQTETAIAGFLLAGDWIDTGLPATIESAAVSGHRAAQSVLTTKHTKPGTTKHANQY